MKYNLIILLSCFLFCSVPSITYGQRADSEPTKVKIDDIFSKERLKHIDELMELAVSRETIPSAVCYVAYKGEPVYFKAFGTADPSEDLIILFYTNKVS